MFKSVHDMIFGASSEEQPQEESKSQEIQDDWVLVDGGDVNQHASDLSLSPRSREDDDRFSNNSSASDHSSTNLSGISTPTCLPEGACGNEAWSLTPPPCFTANSVQMHHSSMENLLIEHPSMSVYQRRRPSQQQRTPSPSSSMSPSMSPPSSASPEEVVQRRAATLATRRNVASAVAASAQVAQRHQVIRERRPLTRSALKRTNQNAQKPVSRKSGHVMRAHAQSARRIGNHIQRRTNTSRRN